MLNAFSSKKPTVRSVPNNIEQTTDQTPKKTYYTFWQVLVLVLGIFLLSQLAAAIGVGIYPLIKGWNEPTTTAWLKSSVYANFSYFLLADFAIISSLRWLLKKRNLSFKDIGFVRQHSLDPLYAIIGTVVYFVIFASILSLVSKFTMLDLDQKQQIGFDSARGSQLVLVFAVLVVLTPLAEELLFRGFLFTTIRKKMKFFAAAIITSIIFGAGHLQLGSDAPLLWVAAIDTFALSLILCYIREKTGRLWPAIYLHMIKNFIAFLALFAKHFS